MIKIMDNISMKFAKQLSVISTSALLTSQLLVADTKDADKSAEQKDKSTEIKNQTMESKEANTIRRTI